MSENGNRRRYPADIASAGLKRLRLDHDPLTRKHVLLETPKAMALAGAKRWQIRKFLRLTRALAGETISSRKK